MVENIYQKHSLSMGLKYSTQFDVIFPNSATSKDLNETQTKSIVDLLIFNSALTSARRCWQPTSGTGSQDSEVYSQEFIANLTIKLAEEVRKHFDEEDE